MSLETNLTLNPLDEGTPQPFMIFKNENNEVGRLSFDNGTLRFAGNANESALVLFKYLSEQLGLNFEEVAK